MQMQITRTLLNQIENRNLVVLLLLLEIHATLVNALCMIVEQLLMPGGRRGLQRLFC